MLNNLLLIVLALFLYINFITVKFNEDKRIDKKIATLQQQIIHEEKLLSNVTKVHSKIDSTKEIISLNNQRIFNGTNTAIIHSTIEQNLRKIAKDIGINVIKVNRKNVSKSKSEFEKVGIEIIGNSSPSEIELFLRTLQREEKLLSLDTIDLRRNKNKNRIDFIIKIYSFLLKSESSK